MSLPPDHPWADHPSGGASFATLRTALGYPVGEGMDVLDLANLEAYLQKHCGKTPAGKTVRLRCDFVQYEGQWFMREIEIGRLDEPTPPSS